MDLRALHSKQEFKGDKKELVHLLVPLEKRFINAVLPRIPQKISTAHLTLMTIVWSLGIVISGYLAQTHIFWLNLFSICIFFQYITDMLDGAVGRARNTGLIKWGFYMDHFLDYVFLSSIILGYSFLLPTNSLIWAITCLAVIGGFMVHVLMDFSITNNFKISCSYFGVSESRLVLILFNVALMIFGKSLLALVLPFFVGVCLVTLCVLVYKCQKIYGHIDTLRQATETLKEEDHLLSQQGEKICRI